MERAGLVARSAQGDRLPVDRTCSSDVQAICPHVHDDAGLGRRNGPCWVFPSTRSWPSWAPSNARPRGIARGVSHTGQQRAGLPRAVGPRRRRQQGPYFRRTKKAANRETTLWGDDRFRRGFALGASGLFPLWSSLTTTSVVDPAQPADAGRFLARRPVGRNCSSSPSSVCTVCARLAPPPTARRTPVRIPGRQRHCQTGSSPASRIPATLT
jgi:hypothetical protein